MSNTTESAKQSVKMSYDDLVFWATEEAAKKATGIFKVRAMMDCDEYCGVRSLDETTRNRLREDILKLDQWECANASSAKPIINRLNGQVEGFAEGYAYLLQPKIITEQSQHHIDQDSDKSITGVYVFVRPVIHSLFELAKEIHRYQATVEGDGQKIWVVATNEVPDVLSQVIIDCEFIQIADRYRKSV